MRKLTVLIVDDHSVVRTGIKHILEEEEDLQIVGEAKDGWEAIQVVPQLNPDVILMDITMPGLGGLEATRRIRSFMPQVKILFLTMHESQEYFFQALQAGGLGYIPKSALDTELLAAIRTVGQGQSYLHPSVATVLVSEYLEQVKGGETPDPYYQLTEREREILHLIAQGHTNREIADLLYISVNTVHNHRANLMEKLGLHDRLELLKYAIRRGLVTS